MINTLDRRRETDVKHSPHETPFAVLAQLQDTVDKLLPESVRPWWWYFFLVWIPQVLLAVPIWFLHLVLRVLRAYSQPFVDVSIGTASTGWALLQQMRRECHWHPDGHSDVDVLAPGEPLSFLPSAWMVLTNTVLLSAWWLALLLSKAGRTISQLLGPYQHVALATWLGWDHEPPDPGDDWVQEQWWRHLLRPLSKRSKQREKRRLRATSKRSAKRPSTKVSLASVLLLGLQAAVSAADAVPDLSLSQHKDIRHRLRKYRTAHGFLNVERVKEDDMQRLRSVLGELPTGGLLSECDSFFAYVDSGCSRFTTPVKEDFIPGTLQKVAVPVVMKGIAGDTSIEYEGRVKLETLTTTGEIKTIETSAYFAPTMTCRLMSPQAYFADLRDEQGFFKIGWKKAELEWGDGTSVNVDLDENTHLPKLRMYHHALDTANALALKGCVTEEVNQNLTRAQKTLLRFHFKLGHCAFALVQWLGRKGILGQAGIDMAKPNLQAPKCAACLLGKQGRTPIPTQHIRKDDAGSLLKNKLEPGALVFSDQYTSRVDGRSYTSAGLPSSKQRFQGGTIFYDAASSYIHVAHQEGFTANETIRSKIEFERLARDHGVSIDAYHTDNGVYKSAEFMKELAEKGQGLKFSGVSAQFQNGPAENAIKIVVAKARTMMVHAALRWPAQAKKDLWPMALSHAAHLYNHTPKQESGLAPIEIFTSTKSEYHYLLNAHPWGCPVYVLEPKLREGQKIPKWSPRSRRGQYMGASPRHASTVGLVRNLDTGRIGPQYHLVYDDFFETVHSDEAAPPPEWEDLVIYNRYQTPFDDPDYIPELADEWLTPAERLERAQQPPQPQPPPPPPQRVTQPQREQPREQRAPPQAPPIREQPREVPPAPPNPATPASVPVPEPPAPRP